MPLTAYFPWAVQTSLAQDAPSVQWFVTVDLLMPIRALIDNAYRKMKLSCESKDLTRPLHELSFHEAAGVRLADMKALCGNRSQRLTLRSLHLAFMATRYLTEYFLRTSRDLQDMCKPPSSFDFILPETSHATVAVQFISYLCSGRAEAMRMMWDAEGYSSMAGFVQNEHEAAHRLRVAFYCSSGGIHQEFIAERDRGINRLLILGDVRQPPHVRRATAETLYTLFCSGRVCCIGAFTYMILSDAGVSSCVDLLEEKFQRTVHALAYVLMYLRSVADIERRHLRTRHILHDTSMNVGHYNARSVNEEVRSLALKDAARAQSHLRISGAQSAAPLAAPAPEPERLHRKKSAYDFFKEDKVKEASVDGTAKRICFGDGRKDLDREFSRMSGQRRAAYDLEARVWASRATPRELQDLAPTPPTPTPPTPSNLSLGIVGVPDQREALSSPVGAGAPCVMRPNRHVCARCLEPSSLRHASSIEHLRKLAEPMHVAPWTESTDLREYAAAVSDIELATSRPLHLARYQSFCNATTKKSAAQQFTRAASDLAVDDGAVPLYKFDQHEHLCHDLCGTDGSSQLLTLKLQLELLLSKFVEELRKDHGLPEIGCVPVLEPMLEFTTAGFEFVGQMTNCNAQSGSKPMSQVFLRFDIVRVDECQYLMPRRRPHVSSVRGSAQPCGRLFAGGYGALEQYTHKQLLDEVRRSCLRCFMMVMVHRVDEV